MRRSEADAVLVAFSLGSNIDDREAHLCSAARRLVDLLTDPRISSPFTSRPLHDEHQPAFLNAAVIGLSRQGPEALLAMTKAIEWSAGRRRGLRFGPRPLDIDLLVWGDRCSNRPELTLPHPRLREREFVLAPLAEVAPDLRIPPDGKTVADLLIPLRGHQGVQRGEWSLRCRKLLP